MSSFYELWEEECLSNCSIFKGCYLCTSFSYYVIILTPRPPGLYLAMCSIYGFWFLGLMWRWDIDQTLLRNDLACQPSKASKIDYILLAKVYCLLLLYRKEMYLYAFSSKKAEDQKIMQLLPKTGWRGGRDGTSKKRPRLTKYVEEMGHVLI